MTNNPLISTPFLPLFTILTYLLISISCDLNPWPPSIPIHIQSSPIAPRLHNDLSSLKTASLDYGNLVHTPPLSVLRPSSIDDLIALVRISNNCSSPFPISVRGHGHSVRGQAMAPGGVVVDISALAKGGEGVRVSRDPVLGFHYADVGGGEVWMDVLRRCTEEHGLAPVSWTDYLYLTVGGTLSNGGISGQSFLHGPQISNVLEMDVVTGKGELITCSHEMNSELFFAVLGGLGQFGIIVRARIVLEKAPTRAKWVRMIYNDFSKFTRDQEHLISIKGANYVEGSLLTDKSPPNNWRSSSFYSSSHQSKIGTLLKNNQGLLYSIELVKYYDDLTANTIDQEIEMIIENLSFVDGFIFKRDVPIMDFLARVGNLDKPEAEPAAHPWLNLFVPRSKVAEFSTGVLMNIIGRHNQTTGPILFYPFNKNKWEDRMSAVTPDENIFYTLGLLHTCEPHELGYFEDQNNEIIKFCEEAGIEIKQYLPHYKSRKDWMKHFGRKWKTFEERKMKFDPRMILSRGQNIFNHVTYSDI
ncbi:cytokinin dehydrogenase 3-like [Salvia splendens]|uniref:cytokinin dehydrogenase 3-like n=1 Tax=Salvia splendens TaxID=180675 RepID=UPI00110052FA|nr:cytokinin dehydrogenase 3-like [Salvia splendens]